MSEQLNSSNWEQTVHHLAEGNFTALDELLTAENASLIDLLEANGKPQDEMNEAFAFACMVGRTEDAEVLLDRGVDPYAGMKTWLAGPHWAASSGQLETIKILLRRNVPLEVENKYGGTVLGQALWSAVEEHKPTHAEIIELLIAAGAKIESGTLEWWNKQPVPDPETKDRVAEALRRNGAT